MYHYEQVYIYVLHIKPVCITVCIRADDAKDFILTVRPSNNYPIDLYLLMDLSYSMRDDLAKLKTLGAQLCKQNLQTVKCELSTPSLKHYCMYNYNSVRDSLFVSSAERIEGITPNFRLGFGSFVDKRLGSFADLNPLRYTHVTCPIIKC